MTAPAPDGRSSRARAIVAPIVTGVLAVIAVGLAIAFDRVLLGIAGASLAVLTLLLALGPLLAKRIFRLPPRDR